jgi:hypothetical protein
MRIRTHTEKVILMDRIVHRYLKYRNSKLLDLIYYLEKETNIRVKPHIYEIR